MLALLLLFGSITSLPTPPPSLPLSSLFLSVKTSSSLHSSRLPSLLSTWLPQAGSSAHLFTDAPPSPSLASSLASLGTSLTVTSCPPDHGRSALCCKMQAELEAFLASPQQEDWFCHLDDDNYVHLEGLLALLAHYPSSKEHYLGKSSIARPLELLDRRQEPPAPVSFLFGTGGAGVCISRPALARLELEHGLVSGFQQAGDTIRLPDDVTLGYLMEVVLGLGLSQVQGLHSHLEPLHRVRAGQGLVTASYSQDNALHIGQDTGADPTGFLKLHQLLHQEEGINTP